MIRAFLLRRRSQDSNLRRETVSHQPRSNSLPIQPTAVRRFVGLLTGICTVYLMVGAVEAPCNDHSSGSASRLSAAAMTHHHGSHQELPGKNSEHLQPCKQGAIPCCVAMTSCGTTLVMSTSDSLVDFGFVTESVPSFQLTQPRTSIAAPEPPPPKA